MAQRGNMEIAVAESVLPKKKPDASDIPIAVNWSVELMINYNFLLAQSPYLSCLLRFYIFYWKIFFFIAINVFLCVWVCFVCFLWLDLRISLKTRVQRKSNINNTSFDSWETYQAQPKNKSK